MFRKDIILLLLVSLVIFIIIIAFNNGTNFNRSSSEIHRILTTYMKEGVVNNQVFPLDLNLSVSSKAYTYATNNANQEIKTFLDRLELESEDDLQVLNGMDYVQFISELFVIGTSFQGKVNINKKPVYDSLNIYFLNSDRARLSKHFKNNCSFIGYYNTIICDANFIKKTINKLGRIQKTYDIALYTKDGVIDLAKNHKYQRMIVNRLKGNVLTWILGHEIGHVVLHNKIPLEDKKQLHFNLIYDEKEKEADEFVVKKILLSEGRASEFKTILGEFIHQEYREQYYTNNQDISKVIESQIELRDFPLHSKIEINQSRFEVPLLLRAVHMIQTLLNLVPEHDSTGYYTEIENNINIKKSIL